MNRRGFLGALAALVAAPVVATAPRPARPRPKPKPETLARTIMAPARYLRVRTATGSRSVIEGDVLQWPHPESPIVVRVQEILEGVAFLKEIA